MSLEPVYQKVKATSDDAEVVELQDMSNDNSSSASAESKATPTASCESKCATSACCDKKRSLGTLFLFKIISFIVIFAAALLP